MKNKTDALKQKIFDIQEELSGKFKEKISLEVELSNAYVSGISSSGILKKLSECRDSSAGMIAALKQLDIKLYDTQMIEHSELAEALDKETRKKYKTTLSTAMKALQPLRKALTGTIKEEALPALVGDIMEVIKVKIWNVLDESASDIYAETVPPMPSPPLQRDENGVQTEALANAFGK
ncbi:MAG: hypothetical protein PF450_01915 [Bacteroidales bacterium]|jgi:hypothetical protein|nr:hypothetical protein [Bacteroidales bacterium]